VASSRILARRGARLPMLVAGLGLAVGGVLLSRLTVSSTLGTLVVAFIVFGIGGGVVNAPITYTAVSGMPASQAGVASGIASTSRQIGQVLGVAITGSIVAGNLHGGPLRTGFVPASHAAWLLLAACGGGVFVIGLITASRWALGTAVRTAAIFDPAEPKSPAMTRLGIFTAAVAVSASSGARTAAARRRQRGGPGYRQNRRSSVFPAPAPEHLPELAEAASRKCAQHATYRDSTKPFLPNPPAGYQATRHARR